MPDIEEAQRLQWANWMDLPLEAAASADQDRAQIMLWMNWLGIPPAQLPGGGGGGPVAPGAPVVTGGSISGTVGTAITLFQITATGSPIAYSVTPALPAGLALNATTGQITGTPTAVQAATVYQMTAMNDHGPSAPAALTITIAAAGTAPIVTPGAISGTVLTAIPTFQISATGSPTSYAVTPALPSGLTLNAANGQITGTPAAAQAATNYQMTATNAFGTSAPAALTITIAAAGVGPGSAVITIAGTGSPPPSPQPDQMWVQDNTNFLRYWLTPPGTWSPIVAGS